MDRIEVLQQLRPAINIALKRGDYEEAGKSIALAVPIILSISPDVLKPQLALPEGSASEPLPNGQTPANQEQASDQASQLQGAGAGASTSENGGSDNQQQAGGKDGKPTTSKADSSSEEDSDSDDEWPLITSYRYRSLQHLPRNEWLDSVCEWIYESVVHGNAPGYDPEEVECQKLPAAIMSAWKKLEQQEQQEAPVESLHTHHATFTAPFCTWRPLGPSGGVVNLPPLHDVLAGILRICWVRHDEREPSRNVIWGATQHTRHDDPTTAYLYVEYVRLMVQAIVESGAEPLWVWHELQEVIEEFPHWRRHPHEVAVLTRLLVLHGCGWRLLNSLMNQLGQGALLMYGCWAALWDGLHKKDAAACARLAAKHGESIEKVWAHAAELTLLQVKEHLRNKKVLDRAVQVLQRVLQLTPAPDELRQLLRVERDSPRACEGVKTVMERLGL